MNNRIAKIRTRTPWIRTAAVVLLGTGLAVSSGVAQQDAPPPPPPDQTQGPPPEGPAPGGMRPGGHGPSVEQHLQMLQKRLNLTPDQSTQIRSILESEHASMETMHANSSLSPADRHTQTMTLHHDSETRIRATLTSEQAATFDQMLAHQRERMENRERGGNSGGESSEPPPPPPQ